MSLTFYILNSYRQIVKFPLVSGSYLKMVIFGRNISGFSGNQRKKINQVRSDGDVISTARTLYIAKRPLPSYSFIRKDM